MFMPIKPSFRVILAVFLVLMMGCGNSKDKIEPFLLVGDSDSFSLEEMIVRFGDGRELIITDQETLGKVTSLLKSIRLHKVGTEPNGVGQLYQLEMKSGSTHIRFSSGLYLNRAQYEARPESARRELDEYIVTLGRAPYPDLLPGLPAR
ncbi:hypothetical protein MJA45_14295 [Paenibacillus aurantius]|uniref:Uncharacterized protein n=1 Tax=Paenibacillus aurantius TaxID=2918900 RepID=A0AA96L886_9BACL|nr:hypothetical protein [Paenibacillus aurantius]WNQ08827.1 hypothetical protein MJA45_14295 [Paenibacillus aurantius]